MAPGPLVVQVQVMGTSANRRGIGTTNEGKEKNKAGKWTGQAKKQVSTGAEFL